MKSELREIQRLKLSWFFAYSKHFIILLSDSS